MNTLYYGDNLDILQRYIKPESVDLIYLDPPFNSNASYNVLFSDRKGEKSAAQLQAFKDTWVWTEAALTYEELTLEPGPMGDALRAFGQLLPRGGMLAYLTMMAPRLAALHRVLKPTGSLYLHCDPTASHYLKVLLDAIFGASFFLNEITWKRSSAHSDTKQGMRRCGRIRDILLVYTKTSQYTWNPVYTPYTRDYLEAEYRHVTPEGRFYKETDLTGAKPGGDTEYEWRVKRRKNNKARWEADLTNEYLSPVEEWEYRGVRPYSGRFWAYSKANLVEFANSGKLIHRETGMPRLVQFADEMPGIPLQDLWTDIPPVLGDQNLGYPTQKPEALLERIIRASSNEGDVVLDPFCGCGTAIAVSQRLDRQWIGIDITYAAIQTIKMRLAAFDDIKYEIKGEPVSLSDAQKLAQEDPYQFQWWSLGLVGARPEAPKKGADRGIDGRLYFHDGERNQGIVISVKAGHTGVAHVRDLRGVIEREQAAIGVLITMQEPSAPMKAEAASAGYYQTRWGNFPKIQLLTIAELLNDRSKGIQYPSMTGANVTYKQAPKAKGDSWKQPKLGG